MNSANSEAVNIHILDREYTVGVAPEERDGLLAAARSLESRMREIRGGNRMAAIDRVAVLAALNLAYELQQVREERDMRDRELTATLSELHRKLDMLLLPG